MIAQLLGRMPPIKKEPGNGWPLKCPSSVRLYSLTIAKAVAWNVCVHWKKQGLKPIAVLASWVDDDTFTQGDGYLQRIALIDNHVLSGYGRIYMYNSPFWTTARVGISVHQECRVLYIIYNASDNRQLHWVLSLVKGCEVCYIHSLYRLLPSMHRSLQKETLPLTSLSNIRLIWDVHGAVCEELALTSQDGLELANIMEKQMLTRANIVVGVTNAMVDWLEEKHSLKCQRRVILPIFDEHMTGLKDVPEKPSGNPVILYSGGVQVWQLLDETLEALCCSPIKAEYHFFVNDEQAFAQLAEQKHCIDRITFRRVARDELQAEYDHAHFGFLLRDATAVNRVACPTKLAEYLYHGVIPILKTDAIGDYDRLGLEYVRLADFVAGRLPDGACQRRMRQNNFNILDNLRQQWHRGLEQLNLYVKESIQYEKGVKINEK